MRLRASRTGTTAPLVGVLAAMILLASGCGGNGSTPGVASLGSGTATTGDSNADAPAPGDTAGAGSQRRSGGGGQFTLGGASTGQMTQFAACMRSHGVPNFPDPNAQGVISVGAGSGLDPGSAQFQTAQRACAKKLPNGGQPSPAQQAQMRAQALKFSACMRSHGVPNFPDPDFSSGGRVSIRIGSSSGIDPRSSQFQAARQACQADLPGRPGSVKGPVAGAFGSKSTGGGSTGGR